VLFVILIISQAFKPEAAQEAKIDDRHDSDVVEVYRTLQAKVLKELYILFG
jgi:hypothetical protein